MSNITIKDALNEANALFIDVRSPSEFSDDHIPNAINAPILDDEERHIVGYTYKQESKDKAYEIGWKIFHEKISEFETLIKQHKNKKIIFYCFRGGTRSSCFVDYFNKKGIEVFKLERGYKAYREYVRDEMKNLKFPKVIVMYGLTGAGKTRLIKLLKNSVDLEGLAKHRSSLFGAVGLTPNSQKMFESELFFELNKNRPYLILEGESRKIGNIIIPENIFDEMKNSKKISITCSIDTRAKRIVEEYFKDASTISELKKVVPKLSMFMGNKKVEELNLLLDKKDYFEFSKTMLKDYYDPLYTHFVKDFTFEKETSSEDLKQAVKEIEEYCETI